MTPGFPRMSAPKAAMAASFIAPDQALDFSVPTILETEDDDNEVVDNPEVSYDILPALHFSCSTCQENSLKLSCAKQSSTGFAISEIFIVLLSVRYLTFIEIIYID